jgi:hypothetical protein
MATHSSSEYGRCARVACAPTPLTVIGHLLIRSGLSLPKVVLGSWFIIISISVGSLRLCILSTCLYQLVLFLKTLSNKGSVSNVLVCLIYFIICSSTQGDYK